MGSLRDLNKRNYKILYPHEQDELFDALAEAVESEDFSAVSHLLPKMDLNDQQGLLLILAIDQNKLRSIEWLVEHGADINILFQDEDSEWDTNSYILFERYTPLARAIHFYNVELVRALIDLGADVNGAIAGDTALQRALHHFRSEDMGEFSDADPRIVTIVEMLVGAGADVQARLFWFPWGTGLSPQTPLEMIQCVVDNLEPCQSRHVAAQILKILKGAEKKA
ncbi:MAG: ankyrin repeat domain-containing protein [Desulfomonile tiedjei]|nr:ankyrin repeat domain-containing protein [Desulfomonile tiedjei]